jgi:hypothetical protein
MNTSKVIDLNNRAVAYLQQGRHKEALDLLRGTIADLKDHLVVRSSCSSPETALPNSSATMDQNHDKPSIFSVPLWTEESFTRRQDEISIFMYAQAFLLAHTDHSDELLIGVVLYNMALVNHARSIEKDSSSHLTVALKYYGMAAAITQSRNGGVNASDYWLLLALYNNMAQIYLSQVCSEKLCLCLGSIRTFLDAERSEEVVDLDDYSFFLTNAMLQLKVVAAPAA